MVFCCSVTSVCASHSCIFWIGIKICNTKVVGGTQETCTHISHVVSLVFFSKLCDTSALFPSCTHPAVSRYLWCVISVGQSCAILQLTFISCCSRYSQLYLYYSGFFRDRCSSLSLDSASPREFLLLQPKMSLSVICMWCEVALFTCWKTCLSVALFFFQHTNEYWKEKKNLLFFILVFFGVTALGRFYCAYINSVTKEPNEDLFIALYSSIIKMMIHRWKFLNVEWISFKVKVGCGAARTVCRLFYVTVYFLNQYLIC